MIPAPNIKLKALTAKELKGFMELNGISVGEMSEILGVTPNAVKHWINGRRDISMTVTKVIRMFETYPQLIRVF